MPDRSTDNRDQVEVLAYRPAQAARAIGVSRSRIHELISAGRLGARKLDGATLILRDDLESADSIKAIQTDPNRTMRCRASRYGDLLTDR
jgi:hypothetical protein